MKLKIISEEPNLTIQENKYMVQHVFDSVTMTEFKIKWGDIINELNKCKVEPLQWRINDLRDLMKYNPTKTLNWLIRHKLKSKPL